MLWNIDFNRRPSDAVLQSCFFGAGVLSVSDPLVPIKTSQVLALMFKPRKNQHLRRANEPPETLRCAFQRSFFFLT